MDRRQFLKGAVASGALLYANALGGLGRALAAPAAAGLSDPMLQPLFATTVPNALDPGFVFWSPNRKYTIAMQQTVQHTGLIGADGAPLPTTVWGYGRNGPGGTWPGGTFVARSGEPVEVQWQNKLPRSHLVPVDTSLHWAYSLHGYERYSIAADGPPAVAHLHGGHSDSQFDGNPEYFFSPGYKVRGPRWVGKKYVYDNSQPAGTLWYHDHALGITRLNVYAGLAGFYILRDEHDTGAAGNRLGLPAHPYEVALAIQDRMFTADGQLFYPAFPGEPMYDDFITGEGVTLPFPGGGPTVLAEFFGDHMLVNGKIWPKMSVEPRSYRLRLLNGCDSRFLAVRMLEVPEGATDLSTVVTQLPLTVIGSDQGLASSPTEVTTLLIETGGRYDVVVDFSKATPGNRVVLSNVGGDEPFGGDIPGPMVYERTDRIMAFDVELRRDTAVPDVTPVAAGFTGFGPRVPPPSRVRRVALFEGKDDLGRLQPLLGTAEPATDHAGNPITWPDTPAYAAAGLTGQMQGAIGWHSPTTENPALGTTEEWQVWNATADAHPLHLHLVHFEILGHSEIVWDSATVPDDRVLDPDGETAPQPNGDGTYLVAQRIVQHDGELGEGFRLENLTSGPAVARPGEYVENAPKDMVTALPDHVTRIKATFDKRGRYVWHCHILSHEDHEMMRPMHVGPLPPA